MKALVTGATGLVGRHLVEYLVDMNIEVVSLGRDQEMLSVLDNLGSNTLEFDLTTNYVDYSELDIYSDHTWFHVAAAISGTSQEVLEAVNIEGTKKLVRKAEELDIPKFILVSSISTYGVGLEGLVDEEEHQSPDSRYGESKLKQEEIIKASTLKYGIVRPPYIGGPYDQNFLEEFASRIEQGKMPTFSKDGIISYIDARDLAQALFLVSTKSDDSTSFNIISDKIKHSELVKLLGEKLETQPPYGPHYPYTIAMIVGFLGEIVAKLKRKSSERGISRYRIRTLCRQFQLDPSKIRNTLGYEANYTISQSIDDWIVTRN